MCELLGLNFNLPVDPSISFRGFRQRGDNNPHGWGIASFSDGEWVVRKEAINAADSVEAERVAEEPENQPLSPLHIAHIRYSSVGGVSLANTHPFTARLGEQPFAFAHNGTLHSQNIPTGPDFRPAGGTDSEKAFCYLLQWMQDEGVEPEQFAYVEDKLRELNRLGNMNLLFSDGKHLFAYRDRNGYNGLCFTRRQAPFSFIELQDEDWQCDLAEQKDPSQCGHIIATRPLTRGEEWLDFEPKSLTVFAAGEMVYAG